MKASVKQTKPPLPWRDYPAISRGKGIRDGVAHRQRIAAEADYCAALDAIESELSGWGLL